MRLIWRRTALRDLDQIVLYIGRRNFPAALALQATAESFAERLLDHPYIHRAGRVPGTREALIHPNYVMIYRVTDTAVEILNVMHSRRSYPDSDSE